MNVPPRLQHLRRDRRGIPVPYVNLWGPERADRLRIGYDRNVGGLAIFQDDDGETVPDFTRQNMTRQRECVTAGRCQVCGRGVPWSRRFLVISSISVEVVKVGLLQEVTVVTEPWLDQWCARFAIERCPGLIRRTRGDDLHLIPIRSARDCQLVVSSGWMDGPLQAESRRLQPYMWAKIHLPGRVIVGARRKVAAEHETVGGRQ